MSFIIFAPHLKSCPNYFARICAVEVCLSSSRWKDCLFQISRGRFSSMWHIGERDERHQQGHNRPLACRGSFSFSEESSFWPAKPCGTLPGEFCLCWAHTTVVRDSNCRARRRGTATVTHIVFLLCLQIESLDAWMLSSLACGWFLETLDADGPPK